MKPDLVNKKPQISHLVSPILTFLTSDNILSTNQDNAIKQEYREWQKKFMLKRLILTARFAILITLSIAVFYFSAGLLKDQIRISSLAIGIIAELSIIFCLIICRTPLGWRYPEIPFLIFAISVTVIPQMGKAFRFNDIEPYIYLWILTYMTLAALIPVRWFMHLIAQITTVIFYIILYINLPLNLPNPPISYVEKGLYFFWCCVICNVSAYLYDKLKISELKANYELKIAREKSEKLLLNILPASIAEQLKHRPDTIADSFDKVAVLFADIVGFTELATRISPIELVDLLNQIFSIFDKLAEKHQLEKIKTIGDAYLVVSGLPVPRQDYMEAIANMALDMQEAIKLFNAETGQTFRMRIGISSGPVVAGVIGLKKFVYDLWGDTVNTASRLESHGIPDYIQVCNTTYECLKQEYLLLERGKIQIKGKGEMLTYLLTGKR